MISLYRLKQIINNIKSKRILLAISGGVDSVFLLHILLLYNIRPTLFYINYNSTSNSNKRKKHIEDLSLRHNLAFCSKEINLGMNSFESKAREVRYKLLNEYANCNNIDFILTAHHLDDQLETLYMKYEDNADWVSFLGIRYRYNKILRPMLHLDKCEILEYAKKNHLEWIEDSSNTDLNIRRNRIRLSVLPDIKRNKSSLISDLFVKHNSSINKFKRFLKENDFFVKKYVDSFYPEYFIVLNNSVSIGDIVLFKLFYQHLFNNHLNVEVFCTRGHWKALFEFISNSSTGGIFSISNNISVIKDRNFHYVYNNEYLKTNTVEIKKSINSWYSTKFVINDDKNMNYNYIESIDLSLELLQSGIKIRNWKYGDKFFNDKSNSYKSLKKIFINRKISVFDKATYPIILDSKDNIIYIPKIYQKYNFEYKPSNLVTLSWIS